MPESLTVTEVETGRQHRTKSEIRGNRGANINRLGNRSEARHLDSNPVESVGQPLGDEGAILVRGECVLVLISLAQQLDRAFDAEAVGSVTFRRNSPSLLWATAESTPSNHTSRHHLIQVGPEFVPALLPRAHNFRWSRAARPGGQKGECASTRPAETPPTLECRGRTESCTYTVPSPRDEKF